MTDQAAATGAVVEFIGRARFADFPADAVAIAKRCIIDGLGVMLAGSTQDAGRILHEHVHGTDPRSGRHRVRARSRSRPARPRPRS